MRQLLGRLDLCSINTATLGHRRAIPAVIEDVARRGFGAICPWRRDLADHSVSDIARQIRNAGLNVSGYCRSTYLPSRLRGDFLAAVDDNCRAIDEAAALGAACFVMVVGSLPAGSRDLSGAREQVAEGTMLMLDHARKAGVRLALEPLHPMYAGDRSCLSTLAQALDLAAQVEPEPLGNPCIGVAVDVYHVWWDPDLAAGIARAGVEKRIFGFHVCDWRVPTRDLLTDRAMMGDGVIDIRAIRARVEASGYDGAVEVEIFSSLDWWLRAEDEVLDVCADRLQSVC